MLCLSCASLVPADVRTCHQSIVLMLQTVEKHHADAWNEPQVFCKNREHSQFKDYLSRPSASLFSSSVTMKKNKYVKCVPNAQKSGLLNV